MKDDAAAWRIFAQSSHAARWPSQHQLRSHRRERPRTRKLQAKVPKLTGRLLRPLLQRRRMTRKCTLEFTAQGMLLDAPGRVGKAQEDLQATGKKLQLVQSGVQGLFVQKRNHFRFDLSSATAEEASVICKGQQAPLEFPTNLPSFTQGALDSEIGTLAVRKTRSPQLRSRHGPRKFCVQSLARLLRKATRRCAS